MYLAATEHAVNAVNAALVRKGVRLPVYYVSKRLLDAKSMLSMVEKLSHCLMIASKKLRPYFQARIRVLTNRPLRQTLQRPGSHLA